MCRWGGLLLAANRIVEAVGPVVRTFRSKSHCLFGTLKLALAILNFYDIQGRSLDKINV